MLFRKWVIKWNVRETKEEKYTCNGNAPPSSTSVMEYVKINRFFTFQAVFKNARRHENVGAYLYLQERRQTDLQHFRIIFELTACESAPSVPYDWSVGIRLVANPRDWQKRNTCLTNVQHCHETQITWNTFAPSCRETHLSKSLRT